MKEIYDFTSDKSSNPNHPNKFLMEENFSRIFSEAQSQKKSSVIELPQKKLLCNPYSQQEYLLSHRYIKSPNTFLCTDNSKNEHHLKVLPCKSYSSVQSISSTLSSIQSSCQSNALLETFDSFEVLDQGRWYFIIVTPTMTSCSLSQLKQASHSLGLGFPRHHLISLLWSMIEVIEDIQGRSSTLGCIFPNTVWICKQNVGPKLFEIKSQVYCLKVSPMSKVALVKKETNISVIDKNKENGDLRNLATAFLAIAGKDVDYTGFDRDDLEILQELAFEDPALRSVFLQLLNEDQTVFKSRILVFWKACFKGLYNEIENAGIEDLKVLHSVLLFSDYRMKSMVLRQLLILSKNVHEVYVYLNENNLFWLFIEECLQISWVEQKQLLDAFFKILKQKPKDHVFKEKLTELGILGLVYTATILDPYNESFLDFIRDFMSENTFTVMQILYDTGVVAKILENCRKSPSLKAFIKDTMSYYGPNSLKLIEEIHFMDLFTPTHTIQTLMDVDYYFKTEKLDHLLSILLQILKKLKSYKEFIPDILKYSIQLITELLTLPYLVQSNHQKCFCSSHTPTDLFYLTKNPFLYYCNECSEPLCSACLKYSYHTGHSYYNLLHQATHFRCNCTENHTFPNSSIPDFTFAKFPPRYTFLPTPGTTEPESCVNRFSSSTHMIITTNEPFIREWTLKSPPVIAYYEVKVNKAGNQEDIIMGFVGSNFSYFGKSGNLEVADTLVYKGPRIGSYDTIGLGILNTQQGFFTYNGLLCSHFVQVEASQEIKIQVEVNGHGWEIEVKMRNFLFQSFKAEFDALKSKPKELFEDVFQILIKACKRGQDSKSVETRMNLRNLLRNIGKEKLAKKLT